jgi:hypothetical protein
MGQLLRTSSPQEQSGRDVGMLMHAVRKSCNLARVVFEVGCMSAGGHHASKKMQREEQSGRDARGPQSRSRG